MNAPFKTPRRQVANLLDELFDAGLLIATGVDGLYGRSGLFEDLIDGFEGCVTRLARDDRATRVHFPPGMPRGTLEKSGYLKSFPQLAGCIHSFAGDERGHGDLLARLAAREDWSGLQSPTEVVLTPAACYPLYPTVAAAGPLADEGRLFDLKSYCFRHEPSRDPARLQLFRMREFVRIGTAEQVTSFRQAWLDRGQALIAGLGLPSRLDLANDPFFGRSGRMLANNQRDQGLKFELLIPISDDQRPTACLSFNYHQDHFGSLYGIRFADGSTAHSACVGFGLERVALALLRHHGPDPKAWPAAVQALVEA